MFHSFAYPDETGIDELHSRFWQAVMRYGVLEFPKPTDDLAADANNGMPNRFVREMTAKVFELDDNIQPVTQTEDML